MLSSFRTPILCAVLGLLGLIQWQDNIAKTTLQKKYGSTWAYLGPHFWNCALSTHSHSWFDHTLEWPIYGRNHACHAYRPGEGHSNQAESCCAVSSLSSCSVTQARCSPEEDNEAHLPVHVDGIDVGRPHKQVHKVPLIPLCHAL